MSLHRQVAILRSLGKHATPTVIEESAQAHLLAGDTTALPKAHVVMKELEKMTAGDVSSLPCI